MVVFTCNHCGESLQKPRVEKHYNVVCRTQKFLTCVDCFKDFRGDEYNVHTKCVSEEKRYSGKDFVEKSKKGEVKQESWMEMIKSIIMHESNLKPQHKNLLETISNYNNVPRKRVKFINFIKSSTGGRTNIQDIEIVWDIIEKHKSRNVSTQDEEKQVIEDENQSVDVSEALTKKKKKKYEVSVTENEIDDSINAEDNTGDVNGISKKKKKKYDECAANGDTKENNVTEVGEISTKKKKNKVKVASVENNNDGENGRPIEPENCIADTTETSSKKKKKQANLAESGLETELLLTENGATQLKKNKKHKIDNEVVLNNIEVPSQKKKKSLTSEKTDEIVESITNGDENSTNGMSETFSFEEQIKQILLKKQAIKKEKLYKKILDKYLKITGEAISDTKIQKKINKKLKKCDDICIEGDFIKIIS